MKKSGYMDAVDRRYRAMFLKKMDMLQQMCVDAAFLAAADVFRMGPGRCEAFGEAMMDYLHEISKTMVQDAGDDPEMDYTKEKVDRRLRQICGEKFEPWEVRYHG